MSAEVGSKFRELAHALEHRFGLGPDEPTASDALHRFGSRAFALQYEGNPTYRAYCDARGASPESVRTWRDVPPVPTAAFKHVELSLSGVGEPQVVFHTSGTTGGIERRGRHLVPRLSLYRTSLLSTFRAYMLPEGGRIRFLSLIPSPEAAPGSSLSHMVGTAAEECADGVTWCTDEGGVPDADAFLRGAREATAAAAPVLVAGTAFAFVALLDELERAQASVSLPEGSRALETGGFKGRSRTVERAELHRTMQELLGLGPHRIVSEYGMTELLSQMYEPVLRSGSGGVGRHEAPPWLGVRALDPHTLEELPAGEEGLLAYFDLANLGSVCAVLTEDVGSVGADGVRLRGRAAGAEPRGCSLALEDLLRAEARA